MLAIRGAEETQALASPTTISGTVDEETGVISGATLSTPPLNFQTVALGLPVDVVATFSQVNPGGGSGSVVGLDTQGNEGLVTLRDSLKVKLVLKIGNPVIITATCDSDPVNIELISTGNYHKDNGGTVVDSDFSIPSVEATDDCIPQVADGVNTLLAGAGHSLSLFIQGNLPVPPADPPTVTTLAVEPSGGSVRGTPVTMTATVVPEDPEEVGDLDPTGLVVFKDGAQTVGTANLAPDGTATLTTSALRSGERSLRAEYQGDSEFAPSASTAVSYSVSPAPIVIGGAPEFLTIGGAFQEFDISIDNTESTSAIANGRVDLTIYGVNHSNLELEQQLDDDSWVPVALSNITGGVGGTLGPNNGVLVPASETKVFHLRIKAASHALIYTGAITWKLLAVDPETGEGDTEMASTSGPLKIVLAARQHTTTVVGVYDVLGLRPGQQLYVDATVRDANFNGADGQVEFLIDGEVMPFRGASPFGPLAPNQTRLTLATGYGIGRIDLPSDLTPGAHVVTARYLGSPSYRASTSQQFILTVLDPLGPLYTCDYVTFLSERVGAYVQAYVQLPDHAADGEELDLEDVEITVTPGGLDTPSFLSVVATSPPYGTNHIEIDLGEAGTLEGDTVDYPASDNSDQPLLLKGVEGTIVVDGEPGDVMPLPIEKITMTGTEFVTGVATFSFTCTPNDEPTLLDEIGVAGVSLTAEASTSPVRMGDPVVLTATAAPAGPFGQVEFFSGSSSLGTASGASGTAMLMVDDLPVGANSLSARYTGVQGSPFRSDVVELDVLPAVECAVFAESGNAAVVRLVYVELLGRCPDQAGFDYWTGRLDGGTSPAVFARSISRAPEAVGLVVDDPYETMLGRAPDGAGRAFWVGRMRAGSGRYDQLLADLAASPEFWALSGSTRVGFVTRVYERLLDRAPDAAGLEFWTDRLAAGASRRALVVSLANQPEPLGRLVTAAYDEILGRAPTGSEPSNASSLLRTTGDRSGLYAELIGTPEFFDRAQEFPNPED